MAHNSANSAKLKPPVKPDSVSTDISFPSAGDVPITTPPATRPLLEVDGSYVALIVIDPTTVRRLMTRTGREKQEDQEKEFVKYVERLCQQRLEAECY